MFGYCVYRGHCEYLAADTDRHPYCVHLRAASVVHQDRSCGQTHRISL